jgi:hypothetical protein
MRNATLKFSEKLCQAASPLVDKIIKMTYKHIGVKIEYFYEIMEQNKGIARIIRKPYYRGSLVTRGNRQRLAGRGRGIPYLFMKVSKW